MISKYVSFLDFARKCATLSPLSLTTFTPTVKKLTWLTCNKVGYKTENVNMNEDYGDVSHTQKEQKYFVLT